MLFVSNSEIPFNNPHSDHKKNPGLPKKCLECHVELIRLFVYLIVFSGIILLIKENMSLIEND